MTPLKANRTFQSARDDRAEVGVGTLIVFIAMVLVAAVAAAVLINTSGTLQERATSTGREATAEVSSNLKVVGVYGTRLTDSSDIDKLKLNLELSAGAPTLDLTQLVVRFSDGTNTETFKDAPGGWTSSWIRGSGDNKVMRSGDLVEITFTLGTVLGPRTEVEVLLIPEAGSPVAADFKTPATFGSALTITLR